MYFIDTKFIRELTKTATSNTQYGYFSGLYLSTRLGTPPIQAPTITETN